MMRLSTSTPVSKGPPPGAVQAATESQMLDLLCTIMVLCRGRTAKGKPFWAYMCIKPSKAKAFGEAKKSGNMNLLEYGSVIEAGEGDEPPQQVKERMEREFGMRHDNDEQLLQAIKKQGG